MLELASKKTCPLLYLLANVRYKKIGLELAHTKNHENMLTNNNVTLFRFQFVLQSKNFKFQYSLTYTTDLYIYGIKSIAAQIR